MSRFFLPLSRLFRRIFLHYTEFDGRKCRQFCKGSKISRKNWEKYLKNNCTINFKWRWPIFERGPYVTLCICYFEHFSFNPLVPKGHPRHFWVGEKLCSNFKISNHCTAKISIFQIIARYFSFHFILAWSYEIH